MKKKKGFYFHTRIESEMHPGGYTVSKNKDLPKGDFVITEYSWPSFDLYFVEEDNFTADERQEAALVFVKHFL